MSSIKARSSTGVLRTITQIRARDSGGTLRTIQRVRARDVDNTLRIIWEAGGTPVDPNQVALSGTGVSGGDGVNYELAANASGASPAGTVVSAAITATPQFGTGPYSYQWSRISGNSGATYSAVNGATTTIQYGVSEGSPKSASFRCTVMDSLGTIVQSPPIDIDFTWDNTLT